MATLDGGEVDHLAGERAAAQFDVDAMKVAWAGSRHAVEVNDRMARLVASDPVSTQPPPSAPTDSPSPRTGTTMDLDSPHLLQYLLSARLG